jgi:sugar phosphate isomerase/epimerase
LTAKKPLHQRPPQERLSISEVTTRSWSFDQDVRGYADAGVDGIGIWRHKIHRFGLPEAIALLDEHDLDRAAYVGQVPLAGRGDEITEDVIREAITVLDVAHLLGAPAVAMIPWNRQGRDEATMRRLTVETLREIAPVAHALGVAVALEPVRSPWVDYMNDLPLAIDICREIDSPGVGVLVDTWHVWDQPDLDSLLREAVDITVSVQFSGYREPTRYENDRTMPGEGLADNARILRLLEDAGYRGWYDVEIFSEDLWAGPPEAVVAGCRTWFDEVWR